MKLFTTIKVGYSSGVFGCTGEYFITVFTHKKGLSSFKFKGLYGAEDRVNAVMKQKGYKDFYNGVSYGKLTGDDKKFYWSETQAIKFINSGFDYEST
jgi:hypothetical protein